MEDIKKKLIELLKENGTINEVNEESFLKEGFKALEINSMSFIRNIVAIEEEFDITFDDYELNYELFETFDDLVALIQKKMEE